MKFCEISEKMKKVVDHYLSHYPEGTIIFPIVSHDPKDHESEEHIGFHINAFMELFDTDTWSILYETTGGSYSYKAKTADELLSNIFSYKDYPWTIHYHKNMHCFYLLNHKQYSVLIRPVDVENT